MTELNMKNRYGLLLLLLMMTCLAMTITRAPCAAADSNLLMNRANACRNSLYKSAERMKFRHNWMNCIDTYKEIYEEYSKTDNAAWALYRSAKMHEKLTRYSSLESDMDKAIELYGRVVEEYSNHRLADDAQFQIAQIYHLHKKNITQAYMEYLKVDIRFPAGDMKPKAREMMDKLTAILGKEQEKIETAEDTAKSPDELCEVKSIRHWSTPSYTRVVIDLDGPVEYKANLLNEDPDIKMPRRLYIDLDKTYVGTGIEGNIPIKDGLLQRARAGQYNSSTVRVVLDIDNIKDYKTFRLHDPFRVVIDVRGEKELLPKEKVVIERKKTREPRKGIMKPESPDETVSLARQLGLSVKRIVLDPGHGGKDPGCVSSGGVKEKDIVLDLAKRLKTRIEKKIGCEVLLTRESDVFIPLDERTAFANVKKADLFISLHVNAHKQASVYGVETYFLNMATDKSAVMVAARENATSEKNISDLQSILNDLMLNTKISESSKLAYMVQNGMMDDIKKHYKTNRSLGVKQAPFYVLIGAEMPAILVETGFITNDTERKRLLSDSYRNILADGILEGIDSYVTSINGMSSGG